jgi:hypothetical protein
VPGVLGKPLPLAVLLAFVVLLPVLDESPLALIRGALSAAFQHLVGWFCGWRFMELLYKSGMRSRAMLSLGVQRSWISALPHVPVSA